MPAEWEPHEATWLAWPHNEESWPGKLEKIAPVYVEMIRHLTTGEHVHLSVNDGKMEDLAREMLAKEKIDLSRVIFHQWPTNDSWMRDCGPLFVRRAQGMAIINWEFNKWGGKYPPWDLDNQIPQKVADYLGLQMFSPGIVMEGGSIDVNGEGILMTTESCLLNKNRNPHLSKKEIENFLIDSLGVSHFIWLGEGIVGDDTDGHIDDLSRFASPDTIVTVVEEDPADPNFKPLQDNLDRLQKARSPDRKPFRIVTLPMPAPVVYEGQRLPASYANFYIGNKVVLVPTYRDPKDSTALETLKQLFSTRSVVGIDSTDLVWGLGAFHCLTQQQPAR